MIRIIGVQRGGAPDREFVLLQNQGVRRYTLRGYAIGDDAVFENDAAGLGWCLYVFADEVNIPPSCFVALFTGHGQNAWGKSVDGSPVYFVYWGRDRCVWSERPDAAVHLFQVGCTHRVPKEVVIRGQTVAAGG